MATQGFLPAELWAGKLFDGQWQAGASSQPVLEPATGTVLGSVAMADPAQIARSAAAAATAQRDWANAPYDTRAQVLRRAAQLAEQHEADIVEWLVRESGSTRLKAGFEARISAKALQEAAALPSRSIGEMLPSSPGRLSLARRRPPGGGPKRKTGGPRGGGAT